MIDRISRMRRQAGQGGFTLIELLVVIIILGVLAAVVVFAVGGVGDKGQSAALSTDAKTVRTAEEAYCARFGTYGTEADLVAQKLLSERSQYTDVSLSSGGNCGVSTGPASGFAITTATKATVEIAANADQWVTSDSGSGAGYSSSAFVYPLNSNLNEPLIIMNSDYSIVGGLASSWERIPVGTSRTTVAGDTAGPSALPSTPTPYPTCSALTDRPFCNDTWRFHIRHNVTFHDGQPLNADDVIWTWRDRQPLSGSPADGENTLAFTRALSPATPGCATNLTLCTFDSVEKIDNFTVDVTPRILNLRFPEQVLHPKGAIVEVLRDGSGNPVQAPAGEQTPGLSSPRSLGRHLDGSTGGIPANSAVLGAGGASVAVASTPLVTGTPQGTGPFKYVSYSPTIPQGGGTAKFIANTNYWGSPGAQVAGMNYTFITDPAVRTAGLQSGQFDLAIDLDPLAVTAAKAAGKRVVTAPYGQNSLIYVNKVVKTSPAAPDLTKVPPLTPASYTFNIATDPAVRKASSLAIDRAAYLTAIYDSNAALGRWMGPPNILGTFQNVVPAMTTDFAAARTALDTDGWTCGAGAPGAATVCGANEYRTWHGDARFTTGRQLDLYMIGISLVPQTGYDLMAAQMKTAGIHVVTERGTCDSAAICPDGSVGRGQMYNTSLWDFDVELPNQNDANAAFLPVLRQACQTASNFRFAPADGTNGIGPAVADSVANGGGTFPFGNTPCNTGAPNTTPAVLGPMDATYVPASLGATTQAANQSAAANMMRILVGQNETNVVIPIVGQFRIYGMNNTVNLGDPHPSQTSQRWVSLTKTA